MKKVWILLTSLFLITSLTFAQQGLVSKDGIASPTMNIGDLYKGINFSPNISLLPVASSTDLSTTKSPYFAVLGAGAKPKAVDEDENPVFPRGCIVANLGIGLGDLFWGGAYGSAFGVSPVLDIDVAITNKLGIGNIGIGGTIAYTSTSYNGGIYGYNSSYKYDAILIGLRGSYHFMLNVDNLKDKLDPYAGVLLGYVITNNPSAANGDPNSLPGKANLFQPGVFAGAHYYFVPHFGVFAELGYNGFSIFTIGISVKTK